MADTALVAAGGKPKRKAEDLKSGEDSTKVARGDEAGGASSTESAVSVYALCETGKQGRLTADPKKDRLVTIAVAHHLADKDRPATSDPGPITTHVFFYEQGAISEAGAEPPAASGGSTTFTRCANEADMLIKFKAVWDAWDPAVAVGHQLQIVDLWCVAPRCFPRQHAGGVLSMSADRDTHRESEQSCGLLQRLLVLFLTF